MNDKPRQRPAPEGIHVDLRGLAPPEPMVTILALIDRGEADSPLIAHFDREPIFLYPELDERGWRHEVIADSGESDYSREVIVRLTPARA